MEEISKTEAAKTSLRCATEDLADAVYSMLGQRNISVFEMLGVYCVLVEMYGVEMTSLSARRYLGLDRAMAFLERYRENRTEKNPIYVRVRDMHDKLNEQGACKTMGRILEYYGATEHGWLDGRKIKKEDIITHWTAKAFYGITRAWKLEPSTAEDEFLELISEARMLMRVMSTI